MKVSPNYWLEDYDLEINTVFDLALYFSCHKTK